jgi:predicted protein tyrosine phosphatase
VKGALLGMMIHCFAGHTTKAAVALRKYDAIVCEAALSACAQSLKALAPAGAAKQIGVDPGFAALVAPKAA